MQKFGAIIEMQNELEREGRRSSRESLKMLQNEEFMKNVFDSVLP
jgi:hypothetical protein